MSFQAEIYRIADELRAIASLGLQFATDPYDKARSEKVLALSARLLASLEKRSPEDVLEDYEGDLTHISPVLGSDAAVFRGGKLLLIRREDDGLWAMPGGLVDVGETWTAGAVRELREETGVKGSVVRLLGLFDGRVWGSRTRFHLYHAVFEVEADEGDPVSGPETTDVGFFAEDDLPDLSAGHRMRVPFVFKLHNGEERAPYYDPPGDIELGH